MKTKAKKIFSPTNFLLVLILGIGFFLRVYRVGDLLGFYYDQGRDALAIWNLWHKWDFFLIGPTTGIAGIFRGPFYYYLIAPFYLLGKGNPVWPSVFLSATTIAASFIAYLLGAKIHSKTAGLIAAFISCFSFNIVMASRWLSNPTPMLLLSMLLVWFMLKVTEGKTKAWLGIALVLGLSLFHFGSAGEVFYFLAVAIFAILNRKHLPNRKIFFISCLLFLATVLPLVIFDIKNHFLLSGNIKKFLIEDKSFRVVSWVLAEEKLFFYWDVFSKQIFHGRWPKEIFLLTSAFLLIVYFLRGLLKSAGVKILLLLLGSMMFGLIFFQGNFGNFYDYYLTGYFLIFILLFSIGLGEIFKNSLLGKAFVLYFLFVLTLNSYDFLKFKLSDKVESPGSIALKSELAAVDWVYRDAKGTGFNVDVYVPPVIPYAYNYLFKWYGGTRYGREPLDKQMSLLYTLYEQDPPHPERLDAWLARQKGIGRIEYEFEFGAITVQRRIRIYEKSN